MGVYIDGGARERMPYEADAYVQQISHYALTVNLPYNDILQISDF
jgi:hypothetical protein